MKMQKYIHIILSLILIVSNLSVAFSMHLCQGTVEKIKLNHLDNESCKMQKADACCSSVNDDNCNTKDKNDDDNCCIDLAYADDIQTQQIVKIFTFSAIAFEKFPKVQLIEFPKEIPKRVQKKSLDDYIASNAPPIYLLHRKLVFYQS